MRSRASRTGTCKLGTCFVFLADCCFSENFRPPRIPRIGTQAYFEFVRNRRERFTFTEDRVAQAVHRREHERLLESGYRPVTDAEGLHRAWASVNPLANGRHNFLRAHGIGNLQYGERYNVFS
jgi:hypothetical protein